MKEALRKQIASFCSEVKAQGMDKQRAWSEWIKQQNLNPKVDAKEFYQIFDRTFADTSNIELPDYLKTY